MSRWLLAAVVGFLLTGVHAGGLVDLDPLNPVYAAGCAPVSKSVRVRALTTSVGLNPGLNLVAGADSAYPVTAKVPPGHYVVEPGTGELMVVSGIDEEQAELVLFTRRGEERRWRLEDIDRVHYTDGETWYGAAANGALWGAGIAGGAIAGLGTLCLGLATAGGGGAVDTLEAATVVAAATGTTAVFGAGVGAPAGVVLHLAEGNDDRFYPIGEGDWQIVTGSGPVGGQPARPEEPATAPALPQSPQPVVATPSVSGAGELRVEPEALSQDDPSCAAARDAGERLPRGCACGDQASCLSGLCSAGDALAGAAPAAGRCLSQCPLGCPTGKVCLVGVGAPGGRCGVAP